MRYLGIGRYNDLGSLYRRLAEAGYSVAVVIEDETSREAAHSAIIQLPTIDEGLTWLRAESAADGVVVFEGIGYGAEADRLRKDGYAVIGGSAFGDRLEADRAFGQRILQDAGIPTAGTWVFQDFDEAMSFVEANPRRYVLKLSGSGYSPTHTYPAELADGRDMIAMLGWHKRRWQGDALPSFLLMEFLQGIEMGTGAYFNGERFLLPACIDWEHKRFFSGDLGEMTGEMGTLVSYQGSRPLFEATLAKLVPYFRQAGHVGYVNINTIVNERGVFPLELTCRFGYPGFAILEPLQALGWDRLFQLMLDPRSTAFSTSPGYCVGVVLTIPPFPYQAEYAETARGIPILFRTPPTEEDRGHMHFSDVDDRGGRLATAGTSGYVMIVTGTGVSPEDAQAAAYRRVRNVVIPKLRYRIDIADRFIAEDRDWLIAHGWLSDA
jgi:phosphoribosylamine--glycine ligase